ncbi:MAG: type II toxin-antitoxin system RelE/ParE family toxin [Bacteroidetes bacterium]|nr:MAG: type II toxin-antitoxin system RelE/ParE family toxin [Bacteroidota bacterium]
MDVFWSPEASSSYEDIILGLFERWTIDIVEQFENEVNKLIFRLSKNKKLCPPSKKKNLRKCVIHKNISLVYRINMTEIELVTFIDNRSEHSY